MKRFNVHSRSLIAEQAEIARTRLERKRLDEGALGGCDGQAVGGGAHPVAWVVWCWSWWRVRSWPQAGAPWHRCWAWLSCHSASISGRTTGW